MQSITVAMPSRLLALAPVKDLQRLFGRLGFEVKLALVSKQREPFDRKDLADVEVLLCGFDASGGEPIPPARPARRAPEKEPRRHDVRNKVLARLKLLSLDDVQEVFQRCAIHVTKRPKDSHSRMMLRLEQYTRSALSGSLRSELWRRLDDELNARERAASEVVPAPEPPAPKAPEVAAPAKDDRAERRKSRYEATKKLMEKHNGNRKAVAEEMGISAERVRQIMRDGEAPQAR